MKVFTKKESIGLLIILVPLFALMLFNFSISQRKARDAQRKQDIRDITHALASYRDDFSGYPLSKDGQIIGCDSGKKDELGAVILRACEWGQESLNGVRLPIDPRHGQGHRYYYVSTGTLYQIFAALEGTDEAEYDPKIVSRNLPCGDNLCNFGLAPEKTPLDKSLEEYENEINAKKAAASN